MGKLAVSDALLERVNVLAQRQGKPAHVLVEELIEDALNRGERRDELVEAIRIVAAMTPKGIAQTDSVDLLREIRGE